MCQDYTTDKTQPATLLNISLSTSEQTSLTLCLHPFILFSPSLPSSYHVNLFFLLSLLSSFFFCSASFPG